jgi:peroxiredoxin
MTVDTSVTLEPGTIAPDFSLKVTPDQRLSLRDLRGQPVVLVFYPADFSPICGDEMALYNEILPEFQRHNAQVLGISVDNIWSHLAFGEERNLHFPLLSDFHPKGEVSQSYLAYMEDEGESARAIYVIDRDGVVAWGYIAPVGVNPGAEGALKALEDLHDGRYADVG